MQKYNRLSAVLFLTLRIFSATGGIENVCRTLGKALYETAGEKKGKLEIVSMYDKGADAKDNPYFPAGIFKGFSRSKLRCSAYALARGRKKDVVILSHVNLLPVGWAIKKLSPSVKLVLLTHGIEIWKPLSAFKKKMIQHCDQVIAVSEYTRQQVISRQGVRADKCRVINNCLDPFLSAPTGKGKDKSLLDKYGLEENDLVLFCLTRLAGTERHKGYDKIIKAIPAVQPQTAKRIVYVIAGRYTADEAAFIKTTAADAGIEKNVILTGFIPAGEIVSHFEMADIYAMPSSKEGFGIVFIEAMYYGLPVIAGNKDGSVDALAGGELGLLVNPDDQPAIEQAISTMLNNINAFVPSRELLLKKFGYETYREKIANLVNMLSKRG